MNRTALGTLPRSYLGPAPLLAAQRKYRERRDQQTPLQRHIRSIIGPILGADPRPLTQVFRTCSHSNLSPCHETVMVHPCHLTDLPSDCEDLEYRGSDPGT